MIFTFVVGGAVSIIGLMGSDGSGVLSYVFSEKSLTEDKVFFKDQSALILNTCFNSKIIMNFKRMETYQ